MKKQFIFISLSLAALFFFSGCEEKMDLIPAEIGIMPAALTPGGTTPHFLFSDVSGGSNPSVTFQVDIFGQKDQVASVEVYRTLVHVDFTFSFFANSDSVLVGTYSSFPTEPISFTISEFVDGLNYLASQNGNPATGDPSPVTVADLRDQFNANLDLDIPTFVFVVNTVDGRRLTDGVNWASNGPVLGQFQAPVTSSP